MHPGTVALARIAQFSADQPITAQKTAREIATAKRPSLRANRTAFGIDVFLYSCIAHQRFRASVMATNGIDSPLRWRSTTRGKCNKCGIQDEQMQVARGPKAPVTPGK